LGVERLGGIVDPELKPLIDEAVAVINKGIDEKFEYVRNWKPLEERFEK
jgi:hypothetical protein